MAKNLHDLPLVVLLKIFDYLGTGSIPKMMRVNKSFFNFVAKERRRLRKREMAVILSCWDEPLTYTIQLRPRCLKFGGFADIICEVVLKKKDGYFKKSTAQKDIFIQKKLLARVAHPTREFLKLIKNVLQMVDVGHLVLNNFSDDVTTALAAMLNEIGTKVRELIMENDSSRSPLALRTLIESLRGSMDRIELNISGEEITKELFRIPHFLNARRLLIKPLLRSIQLSDSDLLAVKANTFHFLCLANITPNLFTSIVQEFMAFKRDIGVNWYHGYHLCYRGRLMPQQIFNGFAYKTTPARDSWITTVKYSVKRSDNVTLCLETSGSNHSFFMIKPRSCHSNAFS